MKKIKVQGHELMLVFPAAMCFGWMLGDLLGVVVVLACFALLVPMLWPVDAQPEPTETEWYIAQQVVTRAYRSGKISRDSYLRGVLFCNRQANLTVLQRDGVSVRVPQGWQTVNA